MRAAATSRAEPPAPPCAPPSFGAHPAVYDKTVRRRRAVLAAARRQLPDPADRLLRRVRRWRAARDPARRHGGRLPDPGGRQPRAQAVPRPLRLGRRHRSTPRATSRTCARSATSGSDRATAQRDAPCARTAQLRELLDLGKALGPRRLRARRPPASSASRRRSGTRRSRSTRARATASRENMPVVASDGRDSGTGLIGKVTFAASNSAAGHADHRPVGRRPGRARVTRHGHRRRPDQGRQPARPRHAVRRPRRPDREARHDRHGGHRVGSSATTSLALPAEHPDRPGHARSTSRAPTRRRSTSRPFVDLRRIEFVQVLTEKVDGNKP